jgi:hypothetical protein
MLNRFIKNGIRIRSMRCVLRERPGHSSKRISISFFHWKITILLYYLNSNFYRKLWWKILFILNISIGSMVAFSMSRNMNRSFPRIVLSNLWICFSRCGCFMPINHGQIDFLGISLNSRRSIWIANWIDLMSSWEVILLVVSRQ